MKRAHAETLDPPSPPSSFSAFKQVQYPVIQVSRDSKYFRHPDSLAKDPQLAIGLDSDMSSRVILKAKRPQPSSSFSAMLESETSQPDGDFSKNTKLVTVTLPDGLSQQRVINCEAFADSMDNDVQFQTATVIAIMEAHDTPVSMVLAGSLTRIIFTNQSDTVELLAYYRALRSQFELWNGQITTCLVTDVTIHNQFFCPTPEECAPYSETLTDRPVPGQTTQRMAIDISISNHKALSESPMRVSTALKIKKIELNKIYSPLSVALLYPETSSAPELSHATPFPEQHRNALKEFVALGKALFFHVSKELAMMSATTALNATYYVIEGFWSTASFIKLAPYLHHLTHNLSRDIKLTLTRGDTGDKPGKITLMMPADETLAERAAKKGKTA